MRRHEMRPGLTGLAQISGRNDQTWEERLALDVWYVDHWSLWLDAKIIVKTVVRVSKGSGVAAPGMATMARFEGAIMRNEQPLRSSGLAASPARCDG